MLIQNLKADMAEDKLFNAPPSHAPLQLISPNVQAPMQRAKGEGKITFAMKDDKRQLCQLRQQGSLKLMLPGADMSVSDVIFINTAGGLAGGDYMALEVTAGADTKVRVASQTAERVYRRLDDYAKMDMNFTIGENAHLDYLPQETIFYDGGALKRYLSVNMAASASFLTVEMVVLGRTKMGEVVKDGLLHDQWRIHRNGKLVFSDALYLHDFKNLKSPALLAESNVFATLIFIDKRVDGLQDQVKSWLKEKAMMAGASCWNGLILIRCLSDNAQKLKANIIDLISFLRQEPLPKTWLM